jgi:hypothetical protein
VPDDAHPVMIIVINRPGMPGPARSFAPPYAGRIFAACLPLGPSTMSNVTR